MAENRGPIFPAVMVLLLGVLLVVLTFAVLSGGPSQETWPLGSGNGYETVSGTAGQDPLIGTWKNSYDTRTFAIDSNGRINTDNRFIVKRNELFQVSFVRYNSDKAVKSINLYFYALKNDLKRVYPFYGYGIVDGALYYFHWNEDDWDEPGAYYAVDKFTRF